MREALLTGRMGHESCRNNELAGTVNLTVGLEKPPGLIGKPFHPAQIIKR